ncbi:hypothetical protein FH063_002354 [Azospirillum argentinense]|uniref:Uncharacterized protein n=1 Tax=Azospirillum argentinense TaxID=2970906 RepID=A0A5B0KMF2_9PROT|nr:hypothetical protein FH063_002354 [Azospirillum argentinense]
MPPLSMQDGDGYHQKILRTISTKSPIKPIKNQIIALFY